jgi:hypothetical protein
MKHNIVTYETGATNHAVNDLILFTDNTRELAAKRDSIYEMALQPGIYQATLKVNGAIAAKNTLASMFSSLLRMAKDYYIKEFPDSHSHISDIKYWDDHGREFCHLYADDFENWKSEHGYK